MLQRLLEWLRHKHFYQCTNEPSKYMGKENYYWHIHECSCGMLKDVMNGECERWGIVHESN